MPIEKRKFTTGLDQDSTQEDVIATSYRYALNIRSMSSDGQNEGAITNTKGNTLTAFTLPSGTNKCIGSYEDKERSKIYYFLFNSTDNHSILQYDSPANAITTVLTNAILKFHINFLITGINVVELDADNHLLYWTDNNEEPKKINIEKGILHSQGNFIQGYATPFLADYIYRIKAPELHPPTCAYQSDPTRNINLLEGHLFQFATQYIYDDFERSAKSPISIPPLPAVVCATNPASSINNSIVITFETGSTIVTKIILLAREGNTGDFFKIATLDKALLNIASNTTNSYSFYNDEVYNFIDINESIKLFDSVPRKSKAQEIIDPSRITDGNILEGFDGVDINAQLSLTILPDPSPTLYGFSGRINIGNFFTTIPDFIVGQPIHNIDDGSGTVFGGFGNADFVNTVGSGFGQTIPLNGFVVYLTGTPYYAISTQSHPSNVTYYGNPADNVYDSSSAGNRTAIRNAIQAGQVYSDFTFSGIPPGKYIMRIASHLTTQADLSGGNLDWQKSSTNTLLVSEYNNHECLLEITSSGDIIYGSTTVPNGGYIGRTLIMDLTNPTVGVGFIDASAITGYVTDKDIVSPSGTAGYLADTRIELAKATFESSGVSWALSNSWNNVMAVSGFNPGISVNIPVTDYPNHLTYTDHNGYIYFTAGASGFHLKIDAVISGIYSLNAAKYDYASPPSPFVDPPSNGMSMGIFRSDDASGNVEAYSRTILNGSVQYTGVGVSGISVVTTQGSATQTLVSGQYELPVYVNTRTAPGGLSREGYVTYGVSDNCIATFSPSSDYYNINILTPSSPQTVFVSPYNGTYDYNNNTVLLATVTIVTILGAGSSVSFKRGSVYQIGIVYYDHGNRSGLTNTNDNDFNTQNPQGLFGNKLTIPFFTEINPVTSQIYGGAQPSISWSVYNQPPVWATHYQFVRTLNSVPNRYLQFTAKNIEYTDDERTVVPYTQATLIGINIQNIANYANLHGDSVLNFGTTGTTISFLPAIGDRIRFIKDANGIFFTSYVDLKIVNVDLAGIAYVNNDFALGQIAAGCLFEIYTPKLQSPTQIYYEIGECYDIGNAGLATRFHKGQTGDQSTTFIANPFGQLVSTVPATGTFSSGDTYSRIRSIPFGVTAPPDPTKFTSIKAWYIEDANFSDFFSSKVQNIGRPNRVDRTFREVRRKSTIYYSEKFVPETQLNGLSSVYDTSFETYEAQYGGIQKLFNYNLRLDCYQELKVGAIPVNQVQFQSTAVSGSDVVGSTATVLNPIRYYQGEFGIGQNPESFAYYGGQRYFFDLQRGAVLRLSDNGLFPIDDYKMSNYFTQKSRDILATGVHPNIYGTYDVRFGEYILAFETFDYFITTPTGEILVPFPGETVAFNEKYNSWATFYSYLPENMCTNNVDIVTFKNGGLYTHNSNSTMNNFYGVQYPSEVWVISNADPSKEKVIAAISEECRQTWEAYEISTPNGQISNLIDSDFELRQNMNYAGVLRDVNTPNITNPLFEGDVLVDTNFLIKLRNGLTTFVKLYAVNIYLQAQERSNK